MLRKRNVYNRIHMQRTKLFPEHSLNQGNVQKKQIRERHRREELNEKKRTGFNLQLLSDGEIPIKEVNVAALLKGHKFTLSQVCYAIILIINNIGLVDSFNVFFFCRKEIGMQKNT